MEFKRSSEKQGCGIDGLVVYDINEVMRSFIIMGQYRSISVQYLTFDAYFPP